MDIYRENILDHYKHPRNFGSLDKPDVSHEENNPFCGDKISMQCKVEKQKLKIARFSGEGCVISMAAASMLTEKAKSMEIGDLRKLDKSDMLKMLGLGRRLSPTRLKCALLPLEALQKAIAKLDFQQQ